MSLGEDDVPCVVAVSKHAHPDMVEFMQSHQIATYRFDDTRKRHCYEVEQGNRRWVPGLHSYLNRTYLASNYKKPKRASWKRSRAKVPSEHKKGSTGKTAFPP
jgi:hypothetical protein